MSSIIDHPSEFAPKPRFPRLIGEGSGELQELLRRAAASEPAPTVEAAAHHPDPPPAEPKPLTDIEYVANSLYALRYGDLKAVARDVAGNDGDAGALADKLWTFAEAKHRVLP